MAPAPDPPAAPYGAGAPSAESPAGGAGALPLDAFDLPEAEVRSRFQGARRQGRPLYPWPDLAPATLRACLAAIEGATREVLAGEAGTVRLTLPSGAHPVDLGVAAYVSGTGPLLGFWIETGACEAPAEAARILALHLAHGRLRWDRARQVLAQALDALGAAGVETLIIKGAHTAPALFPEAGARPAADVDLVVSRAELDRAEAALVRAGFALEGRQSRLLRRELAPPGPRTRLRSLALTHARDPLGVDLHGSLDRSFFGVATVRLGPPRSGEVRPFPDLHPSARVPAGPLLPALLATHASEGLHNLSLVRLVELVLALRGAGVPPADVPALAARLEEAGGLRFVLPAFLLAERLAPGTVDPAFLARLRAEAPPRLRRVVEGLRPHELPRMGSVTWAERFMWGRSPLDHVRRLADLLRPESTRDARGALLQLYRERAYRVFRGTGRGDPGPGR